MVRRAFPLALGGAALAVAGSLPVQIETRTPVTSRVANLHLSLDRLIEGDITFTYGPCSHNSPETAHHVVARSDGASSHSKRLVWIVPEDASSGGCISAWNTKSILVGRSDPQVLHKRHQRRAAKRDAGIEMTAANGIDTLGAWFEGVNIVKGKELAAVDVEAAKAKEIAIVGAGMSGLMSYLILHQAGMTNVSILEAGERLGGRVHTEYLSGGPFDYSYQEMGPMRFPSTYKDSESGDVMNISDHQLVFQLADELNKLNGHNKNWSVDFQTWIQGNNNGLVYRNGFKLDTGLPPTRAQITANASLNAVPVMAQDNSTKALSTAVNEYMPGSNFSVLMAKNMYKAHKEWLVNGLKGLGGDAWSEYAFMANYLGGSLNDTDVNGGNANTFWDSLYEGLYFSAATWKTIDGGLNRLPLAFHPLVDPVTTMNRKIERVQVSPATKKVHLQHRDAFTSSEFHTSTYDFAIVSAPFSIVRKWRLPATMPATITNAINKVPYTSACKVALEFSTRFWEHYENPIIGGCSTTTDIPGIGSICYPSYNINGTGPATLLASYISGDWGARWIAASEEEHVQYVLDAMVEIHGDEVRELYTGKFNRRCWMEDPLESGSWASPSVGQHQLYIPEYFKTYDGLIFVGEHTSYTHAWIASALDSGIRGAVQLLLELGLVDEAKEAVNKWMARWIDI
ncbi:flavin-containing amine oxidoreductase [Cercophora newfieldiana]|uniref:Flavin-containing amine oxidoreductase n=1 Tax=Cercophora newfieldiana TaxID=92897 RepID=A0AA39Y8S7_9PEZI|nr:flavin-containing amine oxidoreductase [Cercophora newfieldiana]